MLPINLKPKSKRGFASMSPEKKALIQSMGGKAVPKEKRAFNNKELAKRAGKRGGLRWVLKDKDSINY
jgi:general stress protein YciG